ncbi:integrating conjugative element protein [Legionella feeleii]|uniref:Tfp pilus assembly, pilus retraction ATPase PilT n=1 Tax=Legionella feeleii TaxID=453 RepID=A0A0W0TH02_9GAMM|nr:integrating conjugative element protein [Legionella feeleii]KTC94871.1 Tfp pilus assembly, pilus retraction ATPase PilT [Legionella feeleii]SPX62045.1 Tfp pilus assembly, pilus retraction ATPase PilT [Legionella feeleii]
MKLRAAAFGVLFSSGVLAGSLFPEQSDYYYQLGSSSDVFVPPLNRDQTVTIEGFIHGGGLSCNLFNPVVSITNTFQDLKNSVNGIPAGVIDNLKGSVAGFPMYKLQQAMPGLYNILQNASAGAQNEFALRVADCQETKRALEEGNSPISGMLSISDSQGWLDAARRAKNGEAVDISKAAKDIANKGEEYGLPWLHRGKGNAGGSKQVPIKVINDVVIAGYNVLLSSSRALDDTTAVTDETLKKNRFVQRWPAPEDAANWAVLVLGDIQVSHKKEKGAHDARAGIGLSPLLKSCPKRASSSTCVASVSKTLWKLVDNALPLTEENLRKISASNVMITDEIITAIQRMPREQQIITVAKLGEEIAIQNLLEEAIMLRHLLQAGMQIQEVQNLKPAHDMVNSALTKLDKEIHSLAFESDVRKKMMTQTLNLIMAIRRHELAKAVPGSTHESNLIKSGAVYQNSGKKE